MEDKEFREQYKKEFDAICASDGLKSAVKNLKPQKPRKVVTPFKATIGTVAAAIMIFAAVSDYSFEKDTSGVISEKVVSTPLPETEFVIVEKKPEGKTTESPQTTQKPVKANEAVIPPSVNVAEDSKTVQTQSPEINEADTGIMPLNEDGPAPRMIGGDEYVAPTVGKWTLEQYYEYLGVNISQKIPGQYTGSDTFEFEIGTDGIPLDDTAVLNFITANGTTLRVTVSKHVLFDSAVSGTVSEAGNGYNAYKISGGVYYNIYAVNTTKDALTQIISSL
ncbi:MAG: hypothetical protein IIX21_00525 [Clostridia bacterium]|nr:hypothetical protein [Clostridia bacterium]MEE0410675.1 hypothetical protein [Clostridia bacterium]